MSRILLDDPNHIGGSDQLIVGTVAGDNTGDPARVGGLKLKQWASDLNLMTLELYATQTVGFPSSFSATLLGTQNDYPLAAGINRMLLSAASGGSVITGLSSSNVLDGATVFIRNTSSTNPIYFWHLSTLSAPVNQFSCPGAVTAELLPLSGVLLIYVISQWTFV